MSEPDYESYSTADLISVQKHIDPERYPDRLAKAKSELDKRLDEGFEEEPKTLGPDEIRAEKRGNRIFWGLIALLILIGISTVAITSGRKNAERQEMIAKRERPIVPVREAISDQYPDAAIRVGIDTSRSKARVTLAVTNAELGDRTEEAYAEELAGKAFAAFAKPKRLLGVEVSFHTEIDKFIGSEMEEGETYEFSNEELRAHQE